MRHIICAVLVLASSVSFTSSALAQTSVTGFPPFSSQAGGQWDSINLANLNVHLNIPITARKGRGLNFSEALQYDSSVYAPRNFTVWMLNFGWGDTGTSVGGVLRSASQSIGCQGGGSGTQDTFNAYQDPFQTVHPFTTSITANTCTGSGGTTITNDGSGYTITIAGVNETATITSPHGTVITIAGTSTITDPNGNQMTFSPNGITDTLGTSPLAVSSTNASVVYTFPTPGGGTSTVTQSYVSPFPTVQTAFNCTGIIEGAGGSPD